MPCTDAWTETNGGQRISQDLVGFLLGQISWHHIFFALCERRVGLMRILGTCAGLANLAECRCNGLAGERSAEQAVVRPKLLR